ncbi:hypothetical protein ACL6C3_28580 [Capilliphycus salinus ALCB114379]|uniref:hypothetical protein n=1 Tax=Capilliphycus salinus TaxID=2768948 RepID=UPI002BB29279|nr:hypothetical protein [Lyngbya sp.]
MFPFFNPCWNWDSPSNSRKAYQERKLQFLKWMRDDLETRLAGLNAAIETVERQLNQE